MQAVATPGIEVGCPACGERAVVSSRCQFSLFDERHTRDCACSTDGDPDAVLDLPPY
jgi:hypothetical protein